MSSEFVKLQKLLQENRIELKFKKTVKDSFGLWLYWISKTRNPKIIYKLIYVFYWLFSSEWLWFPASIYLTIKFSLLCLLLLSFPWLISHIFSIFGQSLLINDAKKNESLFIDLWQNRLLGIFSSETINDRPKFVIDSFNQNWRDYINNVYQYRKY